jgi:hypothetical protein
MTKTEEMLRNARMTEKLNRERMTRQGLSDVDSARGLDANLRAALPSTMRPGNVGDINKVIWPFWFTFTPVELAPGRTLQSSLTITQEAAFVWMSLAKVVFNKTAGPTYTYVDPDNFTSGTGSTPGLFFSLRDSSSSRTFQSGPQPVDTVGPPDEPTVLPTPVLFLPTSNIEAIFSNQHATKTYVGLITLFGYRVRLEDAQNILSTVEG